ncbi:hypothetical protein [Sinorhizobium medicae]|uniref:hypothetical protein n=1 Tax=Sinorhizobium medicae TaxID=110321 RepID=UPI001F2BDCBF|nr:hypothetical protein [Sinorhizobium medicae]
MSADRKCEVAADLGAPLLLIDDDGRVLDLGAAEAEINVGEDDAVRLGLLAKL